MKKLMFIMLALMAVMVSVPAAFARDANRDALKQGWRDQVNLEKQQARIEGLSPFATTPAVPNATKPGTKTQLRADSCLCEACKI
jgi:hypothetical protein